jgi:hypothetical protein
VVKTSADLTSELHQPEPVPAALRVKQNLVMVVIDR